MALVRDAVSLVQHTVEVIRRASQLPGDASDVVRKAFRQRGSVFREVASGSLNCSGGPPRPAGPAILAAIKRVCEFVIQSIVFIVNSYFS